MVVADRAKELEKQVKNYTLAVRGIENGLRFDMHARMVEETGEQLPDYTKLQTDNGLQEIIKEQIKLNYSREHNPYHPLHGVINEDALGNNFGNEALLRHILFPHYDELMAAVGSEDFMDRYEQYSTKNIQAVNNRLTGSAAARIVEEHSVDDLKEYFRSTYTTIRKETLDAVFEKAQLIKPMAYDIMRISGRDVNDKQIEDAILGRNQ